MALNLEENLDSKLSPVDEAELLYPEDAGPVRYMLSRRVGGVGGSPVIYAIGGGGRALLGGRIPGGGGG